MLEDGFLREPGALVGMRVRIAVIAACLVALGALRTGAAHTPRRLPAGGWGGPGISVTVQATGARVEYGCAHGTIDGAIRLDRGGRFSARGTHVPEHGGPLREDEEPAGRPARYSGRVAGDTMVLTVTLNDTGERIGTFKLTRGRAPALTKCG